MSRPNVLVLADSRDMASLDSRRDSEQWNVVWKTIDYAHWRENISEIRELIKQYKIDFVMYSSNDQVSDRYSIGLITKTLETGYSSFSGIDSKDRIAQMVTCFDDFMECDRHPDFQIGPRIEQPAGENEFTFTLVFDTEQLGGVRYGLPRILDLLNRYGINATFFITNLVKKVYPDAIDIIGEQGHEIGIHGLQHEYLSNRERAEQSNLIANMIKDFDIGINGANFIGRMDGTTVHALIDNRVKYFVYSSRSSYRFLGYRRMSGLPALICLPEGRIWALPVSLETYSSPWFSIKNMIDSAVKRNANCGFPHITVLCHTFRDGNLQHIGTTEKMVNYLIGKGIRPVLLSEIVNKIDSRGNTYPNTADLSPYIHSDKGGTCLPHNLRDIISMVPENLFMLYRLSKRNRGTF